MKIAIIRIRGIIGLKQEIKDTLRMLGLHKKNYCTIIEGTPSRMGMIQKVKDYVTWGTIDEETLKEIEKKRETTLKKGEKVPKQFIRLDPPRKGYGRKGIKAPFSIGGALGNRKEKINDLIRRML